MHVARLDVDPGRVLSSGIIAFVIPGAPRDCKVGEWGPWSACSRSCGVGETQRTRKVTIKPRRGGTPCPPLKETKWCGSVNPCSESKPIIDYHW